ncbi:MAG: AIR synthase-related protein [bacterium]
MINRIEINSIIFDTRAESKKKKLEIMGFKGKIKEVYLADIFSIEKKFSPSQLNKIVIALTDPLVQKVYVNKPFVPSSFTWAVEVGYLPGVTDNIANTTKELVEDLLKTTFGNGENVYTSQIILINGDITKEEIVTIAASFYNPIIQRIEIKDAKRYIKEKGMGNTIPRVKLNESLKIDDINLGISDEELTDIGKKGIKNKDGTRRGPLALSLSYMKAIKNYFSLRKRNPTDIELESIAQTWSEHCKHTIFSDPIDNIKNGLFKTYIQAATEKIRKKKGSNDFCVSVFKDNSGAINFNSDYLITDKAETHNSPSALDPYGGSITGIVGVNRDAIGFGMGAKPIINRYGFCFADPNDTIALYKGQNHTQKMLSPNRIMMGVIDGVNTGGNCSGISTPQGFLFFDKRYKGKPLIFVGTIGLIPKKINGKKSYIKRAQPNDYIVMVGGRVGQDGIHGATFSSEAMDSGSPATAVQIGDPITQKKLSDAIIKEARDKGLYSSITDNGAGGLSCSVAEMAKECGGCHVELEKVPLKYPGLAPWQIWISESQERMTLSVPKNKWKEFYALMKKRGVEATIIGTFIKAKKCTVTYHKKTIMNIDMKFLHDGLPKRPMKTTYSLPFFSEPNIEEQKNITPVIHKILKRLNIASFEFLSQQYDHEVQAGSVLKPLQGRGKVNAETTVTKPLLSSQKGIIISQGITPTYSDIDTYHMAACSIDTAVRNAVATGADINNLALLDNFCWCSPGDPFRLGQLKRAVKACYDYGVSYGTPYISGKDSMFNDFKGFDEKGQSIIISIPPTLLISSIAVIPDITKTVSLDLKCSGDLIYLLGDTYEEMGGSEYYNMLGFIGNSVPHVDAKKNKKLYKTLYRCIQNNLLASSISVGRGGLGVALAKTAMGGMLGIDVSLQNLTGVIERDEKALFSESQGRILISINPRSKKQFETIMKNISHTLLGVVTDDTFNIKGLKNNVVIQTDVKDLLKSYKLPFKNY